MEFVLSVLDPRFLKDGIDLDDQLPHLVDKFYAGTVRKIEAETRDCALGIYLSEHLLEFKEIIKSQKIIIMMKKPEGYDFFIMDIACVLGTCQHDIYDGNAKGKITLH